MLSPVFESRLDDLLAAWRHHNDLRRQRAPIAELAQARANLDRSRDAAYAIRRAFNPEPREVDEALATAYCATLDETVFLFATAASWDGSNPTLRCVCGQQVEASRSSEPSRAADHRLR